MGTTELIQIKEIKADNLIEVSKWEKLQDEIVLNNPFIECIDNKSYEEAKKNRTALLKGKTSLLGKNGQEQVIRDSVKNLLSTSVDVLTRLAQKTIPHYDKQQEEIKRYEEVKIQQRAEKERIESERKESIKNKISDIVLVWSAKINELTYGNILEVTTEFDTELGTIELDQFQEYADLFTGNKNSLNEKFNSKVEFLNTEEKQRVEAERLKAEREQFEKEKAEREEKERIEADARKEKQRVEAERLKAIQDKINAENKAKAEKFERQEAEIKAEKERLAKIESNRIAKEKAEAEKKKQAELLEKENIAKKKREEAEAKRVTELAPDKEKINAFVSSLGFSSPVPTIEDAKLKLYLENTIIHIDNQKESILNKLALLK